METRISQAPPIYRQKPNRKRRWQKRLGLTVGLIAILYLALFLLVVPTRPEKPFFQDDRPLVIAHRGGAALAPENTMIAFEKAKSLGVDVIEFDIRMTKDGHLIVLHDETVDRTTNGEGEVSSFTLAELKKLDAAYRFHDIRGRYIYRNQGVTIPTVEEVFQQLTDVKFNIELKEPPKKQTYPEMEKKLWELIKKYNMQEKVLISSFSDDILSKFQEHAKDFVALSASKQETQKFVFYHKLFLNRLYRPKVDAIQLEPSYGFIDLEDERIINGAKKLNMGIHYWTINDEDEMRHLLEKGATGIITDRPDLLMRVMKEMEEKNGEN